MGKPLGLRYNGCCIDIHKEENPNGLPIPFHWVKLRTLAYSISDSITISPTQTRKTYLSAIFLTPPEKPPQWIIILGVFYLQEFDSMEHFNRELIEYLDCYRNR